MFYSPKRRVGKVLRNYLTDKQCAKLLTKYRIEPDPRLYQMLREAAHFGADMDVMHVGYKKSRGKPPVKDEP